MPKRGNITAPTGAVAALVSLADASPVVDSLGGILRAALQASEGEKRAVVIFDPEKRVFVFPAAQSMATIVATGSLMVTLTPSEPTRATSDFAILQAGFDAAAEDLIAALFESGVGDVSGDAIAAPKMSLESAIGRIEDLVTSQDGSEGADGDAFEAGTAFIVVYQDGTAKAEVYSVPRGDAFEVTSACTALVEDVQYLLTEVAAEPETERQFGE